MKKPNTPTVQIAYNPTNRSYAVAVSWDEFYDLRYITQAQFDMGPHVLARAITEMIADLGESIMKKHHGGGTY